MFKDITIGQYVSGNSILHRTDARVKIILALAFIVVLFLVSSPISYVLITLFTVFIIALSKIPVRFIIKGLKPLLFIIAFTVVINLFLTPGDIVWTKRIFGDFSLTITAQGIKMSITMFLRLTLLVCATSLLTLTTKPLMLTDAIEKLLRPFAIIKIPAHEIAMMMSIAIRFIPTLAEETDKIIKAQKARGADFESKNLINRAKAMVPLLIPLFVSAFRRADELAAAMDSRCYNGGKNRTRMKEMKMCQLDWYVTAFCSAYFAILLIIQMF